MALTKQTRYGVPYQGSKNGIAEWVVSHLPPGRRFVDLFAGGCAVTHAAMLSGKYREFLINDVSPWGVTLFRNAVSGQYANETRWISRADFDRLKNKSPYIRLCWSFGNKGRTYIYGRDIEEWKRALHEAVLFGNPLRARKFGVDLAAAVKGPTVDARYAAVKKAVSSNTRLHGMPESLQRLQRLQRLQLPDLSRASYENVPHLDGDVVYCDPPYADSNCEGYAANPTDGRRAASVFSSGRFAAWAASRDYPVFVSERICPQGFKPVAIRDKHSLMAQGSGFVAHEGLYVQERFAAQFTRH